MVNSLFNTWSVFSSILEGGGTVAREQKSAIIEVTLEK